MYNIHIDKLIQQWSFKRINLIHISLKYTLVWKYKHSIINLIIFKVYKKKPQQFFMIFWGVSLTEISGHEYLCKKYIYKLHLTFKHCLCKLLFASDGISTAIKIALHLHHTCIYAYSLGPTVFEKTFNLINIYCIFCWLSWDA